MSKRTDQTILKSEDHTIPSSDGESDIFIRTFGEPGAELHFLLVHGAVEHSGRHMDLVHFLMRAYRNKAAVTIFDHVGHGRSGGPRAFVSHFSVYVKDMEIVGEFVQSRNSEKTKNFILAHSLGGLITLTRLLDPVFGWKFPLSGLIFSSPCIRPKLALGASSEPLLEKLDAVVGKLHLPMIYKGKDLTRDPERANDFDLDNLIPTFITVRMAKEIVDAATRIRGMSYYLNWPSLFLIAGNDRIVDPESTALFALGIDKRLSQTIHYPEHYHELWNEVDRFEIFETMKKWIDKTLKESL